MNRAVKGALLVLVVCLLSFSLSSCFAVYKLIDRMEYRPDKGPFTPFTPLVFEPEGIDHPEHAWTYHWPENYDKTLMALTAPLVDRGGNVYFVGFNQYLYSLNSSGERSWAEKTFFDPLVVCEEGLVVGVSRGIKLLDFDGNELWKKDMEMGDFFLAPDGFLIGNAWGRLLSFDAKGKLRWNLLILPPEGEEYDHFLFRDCFFDVESNGYYLYSAAMPVRTDNKKYTDYEYHAVLVSVTPEGEIRWKKKVSEDFALLDKFLPTKESLVKDTFLLAFHEAEEEESSETRTRDWQYESNSIIIKAFSTDGELLWQMEETRQGYHDLAYAIDQDNSFYFSFHERRAEDGDWTLVSSHLMSWSKEGDLRWSTAIPYLIETPPLLDKRQHLYIGVEEGETNLMAFFPDGSEKWRTKVEVLYGFWHSLTFGSDRSLYFTSEDQSLLFCVRERK
jgi:outer membrane protein assembly factor BamB